MASIDVNVEQVMPLAEAIKGLPGRGGKRPSVSTAYRWATRGVRGGIRLEVIPIGGVLCTSKEALSRFFDRLSTAYESTSGIPTEPSPREREKQIRKAEMSLAKVGI